MKKSLTIEERILLFGFLPQVGDFETLKEMIEVRDLQMIFDEKETREYDISRITTDDGRMQVTFNKESSEGHEKEIDFPPRIASHITAELERLDDEKKLNEQIMSLYEIFVLNKSREELVQVVTNKRQHEALKVDVPVAKTGKEKDNSKPSNKSKEHNG